MKIDFSYDEESDILYAFVGKPVPAICEEPVNGILIRRDIKTRKVVGFTIINYKRQKRDGHTKNIPCFQGVKIPY